LRASEIEMIGKITKISPETTKKSEEKIYLNNSRYGENIKITSRYRKLRKNEN
jgi:hypothetical protein